MIKVLVNGCNGKMGQEVVKAMDSNSDLILVGGYDRENTGIYTFPVYTDFSQIEEKPDVIIDFSVPVATINLLDYCKKEKIPMVIATTGFSKEQLQLLEDASKNFPIFQSANMSYEINLMANLVSNLAKQLTSADIEIIETHHNRKIDSPSGTALLLADSMNQSLGNTMHYEYNRHDKHEKRPKNEIGISSIRGGNIVGEHIVSFFSENETFEIKHTCYSRTVFAEGSLKAAKYIVAKSSGFYHMNDLIKDEQES